MIAPRTSIRSSRRQTGAAMLILLLILIMGSATLLLTQLNKGDPRQPRSVATVQDLGAVRDALIGYSLINGNCLPCPSQSATDGEAPGSCNNSTRDGFLPWATLNLGHADTWGRRLRYVVDPDFAGSGSCTVTQAMNGDIRIQGRNTAGAPFDLTLDSPAVVISHGVNGFGAVSADGGALPNPPPGHVDEETNRTGTTLLFQRVSTDNPTTIGGPFDDLMVWVSLNDYKMQLERVNGGPLPP